MRYFIMDKRKKEKQMKWNENKNKCKSIKSEGIT